MVDCNGLQTLAYSQSTCYLAEWVPYLPGACLLQPKRGGSADERPMDLGTSVQKRDCQLGSIDDETCASAYPITRAQRVLYSPPDISDLPSKLQRGRFLFQHGNPLCCQDSAEYRGPQMRVKNKDSLTYPETSLVSDRSVLLDQEPDL